MSELSGVPALPTPRANSMSSVRRSSRGGGTPQLAEELHADFLNFNYKRAYRPVISPWRCRVTMAPRPPKDHLT